MIFLVSQHDDMECACVHVESRLLVFASCFGVCVNLCVGIGTANPVHSSQMGWTCRLATERLPDLHAISVNSIITHN